MKQILTPLLGSFFLIACSSSSELYQRKYELGEHVLYKMKGRSLGKENETLYRAKARAEVKKNKKDQFVEEFSWSELSVNEKNISLNPESEKFRLDLSLDPKVKLNIPDISKLHPDLIGPVLDLMTVYADLQMSHKDSDLHEVGDSTLVKHGSPNSWADGQRLILAEDAVDFEFVLLSKNEKEKNMEILIKHMPPKKESVRLPAKWMQKPVGHTPNNWVQVRKLDNGTFVAAVGKENFTVKVKLDQLYGKIIEAYLDNTIEVVEKNCKDVKLEICGASDKYEMKRELLLY